MKRTKPEYEVDVSAMIGKRLRAVRYFEIKYSTDEPFYISKEFSGHLLDYGCDLEMDDGSIFAVIWDGEFFQYGVGVFRKSLSSLLAEYRCWDVTNHNHWAPLTGQIVTVAKVFWSWAQYEGCEKIDYPQDLGLKFADGSQVFFSAAQYREGKDVLSGISDNIAVLFGCDDAKKYCVGPYAEDA